MRILILNDGSNYSNWGIKACLDGLLKLFENNNNVIDTISHEFLHKKFNIKTTFFNKRVLSDENIFLNKFYPPFIKRPYVADDFDELCDLWTNGQGGKGVNYIINKVKNSDVVLFNAEGSAYRNNIGAITGIFILYYSKIVLKKRAFFINGSLTISSEDPRLPAMIKVVHDNIDGFFIRELESYNLLNQFLPNSKKIFFSPDSVFNISNNYNSNKIDSKFIESLGNYVCISKSMVASNKFYFKKLIEELTNIFDNVVLLAKDNEDQYLKNIINHKRVIFLGKGYNYFDIQYILKFSKGLISGRYHHLIFALKQGVPVIMLNTSSHKIIGLNKMFKNQISRVFDPGNLKNEMNGILNQASIFHKIDKNELMNISMKYREELKKMKSRICD